MGTEVNGKTLHIVMLPWLAMGHLTPFFRLAKRLASRGVRVSFISTPKNIQRLVPKTSQNLSPLIELFSFPLPSVEGLSSEAECTTDLSYKKQPLLKLAFELLEDPIAKLLAKLKSDWIIYDYVIDWIQPLASNTGSRTVFFSTYNASTHSFVKNEGGFFTEHKWSVPVESNICYRQYENAKHLKLITGTDGEIVVDTRNRFDASIGGSSLIALRSGHELESTWIHLIEKFYQKPVLPLGYLFPFPEDDDGMVHDNFTRKEDLNQVKCWLDKQRDESVIYVAFGSEAIPNQEELTELALGLELSGLPFLWIIRFISEPTHLMLPQGFEERTSDRGLVYKGWVPQVDMLSHPAIGGFLTHCGWNSVIEGLGFGRVLILFPFVDDQPLVARLLQGERLGVEIERNEQDGAFTNFLVAKALRLAMVATG